MMKRIVLALAAMALARPATGNAQAITAGDPKSVAAEMQAAGYKAEIAKLENGDPIIHSSSGGSKFAVFFFGCEKGANCTEIQFYAGWTDKASLARINEWNRKHRFGRAYLDDKNEMNIEYDVNLEAPGGISAALFRNDLELWAGLMGSFQDEMTKPAK